MARAKLATPTVVYVVEECMPYDGSTIIQVHTSLETAKEAHSKWTDPSNGHTRRWKQNTDGSWTNQGRDEYAMYLLITAHELRP